MVRRRKMCRNFLDRPVEPVVVDRLLARACRAPSAGHTQGWAFLVLEGSAQTRRFWQLDADPAWLAAPTHPGLLRAPVIVLPLASRNAYLSRYAEADKLSAARTQPEGWPAPYWLIDASFATMLLLLGAVDEGLGALFFALHAPAPATLAAFGVPDGWEALGAVALGWPAPEYQPSASAARGRRPFSEVVHRGRW